MINSIEQAAQRVTSSFHSHLQRRHANTGDFSHLFVSHFFDVLQQKRLSLVGRQRAQCALDMSAYIEVDFFF